MRTQSHRRLRLAVRPPRVATVVPLSERHDDREGPWRTRVTRMVENYTRLWGGAANLLIPWRPETGIPDAFMQALRAFDPDWVAWYRLSARGWQLAKPDDFDEHINSRAAELVEQGREPGGLKEELTQAYTQGGFADTMPDVDDLEAEVRRRLAAFGRGDRKIGTYFTADDANVHLLVDLEPLLPDFDDSAHFPLVRVSTSIDDEDLRLMLAARVGALNPSWEERLAGLPQQHVVIPDSGLRDLLDVAWTGTVDEAGAALRRRLGEMLDGTTPAVEPWTDPDIYTRSPMAWTRLGCNWYRYTRDRWERRRQATIVVGDTPEDFLLWFCLDRLYQDAAWCPLRLAVGDDELARAFRSRMRYGFVRGRNRDGTNLRVTSLSVDADRLRDLAADTLALEPEAGDAADDDVSVSVVVPERLAFGMPWRLLDAAQTNVDRFVPFDGTDAARPLDTPTPSGFAPRDETLDWLVDVEVDGELLPNRSCLAPLLLSDSERDINEVRAGADGTAYAARQMGLVTSGTQLERRLFHPRLRHPTALEVFEQLVEAGGLNAQVSDAGRYSQFAVESWGGLAPLAADLADPVVWATLQAYRSQAPSGQEPGCYVGPVNRRYLTVGDVTSVADVDVAAARELTDRLVQMKILRRGYVLRCDRCSWLSWYPLEEVGQAFACTRCRATTLLAQQVWREPVDEPATFYELDELVFEAVRRDFDVPVLALHELADKAWAFLYGPELLLSEPDGTSRTEVDIWAVIDGALCVGEGKSTDRLAGTAREEQDVAARLFDVSERVTAEIVVFATGQPQWRPATRELITELGADTRAEVCFLEGLRDEPV